MLQVAAGRRAAAALAASALIFWPNAALAQDQDPYEELNRPLDPNAPLDPLPAEPETPAVPDVPLDPGAPLDPSAPLDPMPDIGIEWPDLARDPEEAIATTPDTGVADSAAERSYSGRDHRPGRSARGRAPPPVRPALHAACRTGAIPPTPPRSTAGRARMPTCSSELLRAHGYYDALVRTRVEAAPAAGGAIRVAARGRAWPALPFRRGRACPGIDAKPAPDSAGACARRSGSSRTIRSTPPR